MSGTGGAGNGRVLERMQLRLGSAPTDARAMGIVVRHLLAFNLLGLAVLALLLLALSAGARDPAGRSAVVVATVGYLVVALPLGVRAVLRRQDLTVAWLREERHPTAEEATQALRLPVDVAVVVGVGWLVGGVLVAVVGAVASDQPVIGLRLGLAALLGGVAAVGHSYLLALRLAGRITAEALAAHPPAGAPVLGVRLRLLLTWALTSGVPLLGLALLFLDPSNPEGPREDAVVFLVLAALLIGVVATHLTARSVGNPLRELRRAVQRVGRGDHDVRVPVDDAGEIGLLQEGVNTMVAGLAERERLRDLFGRHVGTTVAQRALATGVSLGGELRTVAALFVDIAGSTTLVRRTGPEEMVGLLNRFFAVVVDTVETEGGLVNKFEGDAALCVFGAPAEHSDPAGAALRAARRICRAVAAAGEVDVGVGVACGPVWAGQVGAASRLEYTVIGDPVNVAARLTDLAKDHPGRALADDATVQAALGDEAVHWAPGAVVQLRGRDEPTRTWGLAIG